MRIIVRSKGTRLWLPFPLFLADTAVFFLPESMLQKSLPPPYGDIITKKLLRELVRECRLVLKEYKGLELVHVEAQDGTFVSIHL